MKEFLQAITKFFEVVLTSPWRAIAAFFFLVIIGIGAFAWDDRDMIATHIFADKTKFSVNKELFEKQALNFIQQNDANVAILWEVHLEKNLKKTLVAQTLKLGRVEAQEGKIAPIFTTNAEENEQILKIFSNETFCAPLVPTSSIGELLKANNVNYICRSGIISPEGLLIGYITVGYKTIPNAMNEEIIRAQLNQFSDTMIRKTL